VKSRVPIPSRVLLSLLLLLLEGKLNKAFKINLIPPPPTHPLVLLPPRVHTPFFPKCSSPSSKISFNFPSVYTSLSPLSRRVFTPLPPLFGYEIEPPNSLHPNPNNSRRTHKFYIFIFIREYTQPIILIESLRIQPVLEKWHWRAETTQQLLLKKVKFFFFFGERLGLEWLFD